MTHPITIGRPSRQRELYGAGTLLLGAAVLVACTLADWKGYQKVAVLGAAIVAAWLVDGTSRRYVGAGLATLAVGGGITLGSDVPISHYEHTVVYGAIGLALVVVSLVNPAAVRASGAAMIFIALTAYSLTRGWADFDPGWEMAAVLGLWGTGQLVRFGRSSRRPAGTGEDGRVAAPREPARRGRELTSSR